MVLFKAAGSFFPVDNVVCGVTEASDRQWTDLLVEGEVVEVHLAASLHRQPLRVLDAAVRVDPDESGNARILNLFGRKVLTFVSCTSKLGNSSYLI